MKERFYHRFWSEDRSLSVFLPLLILFTFFITPFSDRHPLLALLFDLMSASILISGIATFFRSRVFLILGIIVATAEIGITQLRYYDDALWIRITNQASEATIIAVFCALLLRHIIRGRSSNIFIIQGAIATYIMIALFWSHVYLLFELVVPGSFSSDKLPLSGEKAFQTMLYFSSITLTTVGFGDVLPVHSFARSLVCLEAFIGVLYPTILIARLVSLEIQSQTDDT